MGKRHRYRGVYSGALGTGCQSFLPEELKDRLDNGEAILVVDSRSTSTFESRHIAGAISVPDFEVESRLDEFPRDQEIVFY